MIFVALDISTKFVAYSMWNGKELVQYGKIYVSGTGDEGIGSLASAVMREFDGAGVDVVIYESAFLGNNVNVVKQLSKTTGSIIGAFSLIGVSQFLSVPPITWQTGIGVGKTSVKEKEALAKRFPGKSTSWLKNKDRENRKQKVIDFVNREYDKNFVMSDNDVADSIGIGHYALQTWKLDEAVGV